jgi:tetratricopeptide (TPR) repeat protein
VWITHNKKLMDDFVQNSDLIKNLHIQITSTNIREIFQEIMRQLRNLKQQPNLLIIDNATTEIEPYLNELPGQPNWHLLLTSRMSIAGLHTKQLGFLKPDEAIKLFQKHCQNIDNTQDIGAIVQAVDYHTLSIEILAKTAQRRGIDSAQLQTAIDTDLKANIKTSHSQRGKIDKITSYLCSVFDLSDLNKEEISLLQQFSCLPAEFINTALLQKLLLDTDNDKAENLSETLSELKEKGWLLNDSVTNSYRMHRIISAVISVKYPVKADDISYLIKQVSQLLSIDQTKDNPVDKFKWIAYGQAIDKALPESTTEQLSELQNNLALVLKNLGDFKSAKILLEKALTFAEKNYSEGHPTKAVSYSNLALVLKALGDFKAAKVLLEKAVISDEKNFGEEHPTTAIRYSNLALVLKGLEDFKAAKGLLEKAITSDEKNFGEEHPTTAVSYSNLASVLQDLGDFKAAKDLLAKAITSSEKNFGERHPTTAIRYSRFSSLLRDLGDINQALPLAQKALKIFIKSYPEGHPYIKQTQDAVKILEKEYTNKKN